MTLTNDEARALGFVAALLFVSAAVRVAALPPAVPLPAPPIDLDAHIAATERAVAEAELMARPLAEGERVDPSTATVPELARLPRVGVAMARRIIEDRERNGPFTRPADLARVPGIGDRMVEQMAPHLVFPNAPRLAAPRAGVPTARPVVHLNRATAADLAALPGIGPAIAARIIAHRDSTGPFHSADDLLAVRGIGPATLTRLHEHADLRP